MPSTSLPASSTSPAPSLAPAETRFAPSAEPTLEPAPNGVSGTWTSAPPLTYPRAAHAVVATTDAVFVLAGTGNGRPVDEIERFDGTAWTVVTQLPGEGLNAPAAAALDGLIYLIGGFGTTTNVPAADVWTYDPARDEWSSIAPLPAPRGGHAAVVLDDRIHVLGGGNSTTTLAAHTVYDPATDRWSEAAPLPRSEGSPAATVLDGSIVAIGGRSGIEDFGEVDVYDPSTDTWTSGPAIPPRGTAGAAVRCGAIYLFGGESQSRATTLDDVLRLAPDGDRWQVANSMPTARSYARAVQFDDAVLTVGGNTEADPSHAGSGSTVVERFEVAC